MAFKLVQSESYKWTVKITLPTDANRKETSTFTAEFKRLAQARINEIIKDIKRTEYTDDEDQINDIDAAKELIIGWSDVKDDDDKDIPFSNSALDELLNIPTVAAQIVTAWFGSQEIAKRKN